MFLSLKTVMVTSVAVGGLATGVAGASPPHGNDVVQSVTAAAAEEAQLHTTIDGLKGTETQLEALLADHLHPQAAPLVGLVPADSPPTTPGTPGAPSSPDPRAAGTVPAGATPTAPSPGPTSDTGRHEAGGGSTGSPTTTQPHAPTTTTSTEPPTTVPPTTTTTTQPPPPTTTTTTRPHHRGGND